MALLQPPTLSRLIKEARIFLNQKEEKNSFWKDDELSIYANDAIRQYFLILSENAEGQFDEKVSLDLVAGQETIALPTDCFEVRAIFRVQNEVNQILQYKNNLTESYDTSVQSGGDTYVPYYYFRGESIVLRPVPGTNEVGGLVLEYTKFPETLITGLDAMTSNISTIFKELVVMYMVYKAKLKESSVQGGDTYRASEGHLSSLFTQFKNTVGGRSKFPQYILPFNP
jgi:hypothetical protein